MNVSQISLYWLQRRRLLTQVWLVAVFVLAACSPEAPVVPTATPITIVVTASVSSENSDILESIWSAVDENYVYRDAYTTEWLAARVEYLTRVSDGMSPEDFAEVVQDMLAELPDGAASWQSRAGRIEQEQDTEDTSSYEGIGAFVSVRATPEPRVVVLSVMPGSPAQNAGVVPHESIIAIDGVPVRAEEGIDVINRIRGPAGSDVVLTMHSPDNSVRDVVVTRGRIATGDTLRFGAAGNGQYAYLLFPPLAYEELPDHILGSLEQLSTQGEIDGLIIDLRIARGGGWPLEVMATVFGNGDLGEFYSRDETQAYQVEGQDVFGSQDLPLVIIVGH